MHLNRPMSQTTSILPPFSRGLLHLATGNVVSFLLAILIALGCSLATPAQQPSPASPATPTPHTPHPDDRHGPPHSFLLPRPDIHPPKGKVPAPGTPVVFDASRMGSPLVLDHNWRLGIAPGEDPAKPDFDDSTWPTRDAKDALAEVDDSAADDDKDNKPDHPADPNAFSRSPAFIRSMFPNRKPARQSLSVSPSPTLASMPTPTSSLIAPSSSASVRISSLTLISGPMPCSSSACPRSSIPASR